MHIKRFDPANKNSFALVIKKEERKEGDNIGGKKNKKQKTERQMLMEEGRLQVLNKRNTNQYYFICNRNLSFY